MGIWFELRMGQYRDGDHREDAIQFIIFTFGLKRPQYVIFGVIHAFLNSVKGICAIM